MLSTQTWLPWALGSACFAALTAVFAKLGLEGIDSDYATLLRTVVIVLVLSFKRERLDVRAADGIAFQRMVAPSSLPTWNRNSANSRKWRYNRRPRSGAF